VLGRERTGAPQLFLVLVSYYVDIRDISGDQAEFAGSEELALRNLAIAVSVGLLEVRDDACRIHRPEAIVTSVKASLLLTGSFVPRRYATGFTQHGIWAADSGSIRIRSDCGAGAEQNYRTCECCEFHNSDSSINIYRMYIFTWVVKKSNSQNTCLRYQREKLTGSCNEEGIMSDTLYPSSTGRLSDAHNRLTPEPHDAFQTFGRKVFANGALTTKTKQLIAVAVAHVTQCPYCIRGHTKAAMREGATREELMESIWVAAEMPAGAAYAHSVLAIDEMENAAASSVTDGVVAID
jgi:AhpD family alkylhydroperoxidase